MTFDVDIPDLPAALRDLIAQIPPGRVTTYATLAEALGSENATRWVGGFVLDPAEAVDLPVHRIVRAGGKLGLYFTGDPAEKQQRLRAEGIAVENDAVELSHYFFDGFESTRPLCKLRSFQADCTKRLRLLPPRHRPQTVGGVDVSYITEDRAVAGYALVDAHTHRLLWSTTLTMTVEFPYVPTFLGFRELPLLLRLIQEARREEQLADVIFVDGNGVLHNHRMGIASMLGVVADLPTVGISKKLLCGTVDLDAMTHREARPVVDDDEVLGMALKSRATSKPIFVSPGHRVDFDTALGAAQQLLAGHRLPEPIYWADKLSREEVRRISAAAQ